MCKARVFMENLQVWKTIQYAAENQGTDGERSLRGHAYQPDGINPAYQRCCSDEREKGIPRQKVLRHSLLSHHVPWVHEDHRPQLFCFLYITGKFKNKASSKLERERERATSNTGRSSGESRFQSFTWLPICTPARPSDWWRQPGIAS